MTKQGKLKIIPLGGLGEVGKNMTAYEFNQKIIIVDAGIMFPENDMLGIDYIIPDYEYVRSRASQVVGIIITHPGAGLRYSSHQGSDRSKANPQRFIRLWPAPHCGSRAVH
jgi:predicted metal-dependent RNase